MSKLFFSKDSECEILQKYMLGDHLIFFPQNDEYIYFFKKNLEERFKKRLMYTCFGDEFTIIFF